ncbi:hypothetical protein MNQ95_08805 [Pseudoxanthomonas daejeonensis]|uniref:hypothetical protein n=1 Tax=Pseudoxanthomonas daejeonensis TaxID=266062 RepID=UPI001F540A18|nr:hypothetical protein [Pseudoxanthomonas daejeonensis]UNK56275.1 hypothetical protein MNQ95_08805 [Pseudoxanthomonas daejeonensis]
MADAPSQLSSREELMLLYQITVSDLTYFKSQQWSLTNYAFLLLAGLIGVDQLIGPSITIFERSLLVFLAFSIAAAGITVLSKLQRSIEVRQARLGAARNSLSSAFIAAWSAEVKGREYLHSIWFLRAAIVAGAAIVCWVVLR